jgi:proteic killer suppression protein
LTFKPLLHFVSVAEHDPACGGHQPKSKRAKVLCWGRCRMENVSWHGLPFAIQWETAYYGEVIRSFWSKDTARLFHREHTRKYAGFQNVAKRKLDHVNAATSLSDLAAVPGNHFESLIGGRLGQYSIRINDRWRICFEWKDGDAYSVEIVDYH